MYIALMTLRAWLASMSLCQSQPVVRWTGHVISEVTHTNASDPIILYPSPWRVFPCAL